MNKKYRFDRLIFNRYAVWYMETPKDKSKLGVWKIIDCFPGTKPTKFAFRWKVKDKDKTQEQLDEQILNNATKNFCKSTNISRGNCLVEKRTQSRAIAAKKEKKCKKL